MKSDIFDDYAKIALEQGLISEGAEETNPRYDSKDLSTIEVMYNVKPNGKDEKNIIEQAHPEPCIIAPSYDKLNGLVENLQEQHNIMVGIVMKPHQAKLTQHRYAAAGDDLFNSLISLGFTLDNKDETELCKLADSCAERIQKVAWWPLVAVVGSALGGLAYYAKHGFVSQNIETDGAKAVAALDKLAQVAPRDAERIQELISGINFLRELNNDITNYTPPQGANQIDSAMEMAKSPQGQAALQKLQQFKKYVDVFTQQVYRPKGYAELLQSVLVKEEGTMDWLAGLKKLWRGMTGDVKSDAMVALIGTTSAEDANPQEPDGFVGTLNRAAKQLISHERASEAFANRNKDKLVEYMKSQVEGGGAGQPPGPQQQPAAKPVAPAETDPKTQVAKQKSLVEEMQNTVKSMIPGA